MKEKKTTWHTLTVLAMWSIIVCSLFSVTAKAQTATFSGPQPKHEVRAVWLTTIGGLDWPHSYAQSARSIEKQKQEMRHILDRLQQAGINTVLLQTRIRATTIYPSQLEHGTDACRDALARVRDMTRSSLPSTSVTIVAWSYTHGWSPYPWANGTG